MMFSAANKSRKFPSRRGERPCSSRVRPNQAPPQQEQTIGSLVDVSSNGNPVASGLAGSLGCSLGWSRLRCAADPAAGGLGPHSRVCSACCRPESCPSFLLTPHSPGCTFFFLSFLFSSSSCRPRFIRIISPFVVGSSPSGRSWLISSTACLFGSVGAIYPGPFLL